MASRTKSTKSTKAAESTSAKEVKATEVTEENGKESSREEYSSGKGIGEEKSRAEAGAKSNRNKERYYKSN